MGTEEPGENPDDGKNPVGPVACAHVYGTDNKCKLCGDAWEYTEGLAYTLNSDGNSYTVKKGTAGDATEIVIPYYYEGKPVTSIGNQAFLSCDSLTDVYFGGSDDLKDATIHFAN